MKVKSKKGDFQPITVILETTDEVRALYCFLDMDDDDTWDGYCKEEKVKDKEVLDSILWDLFQELDDVVEDQGIEIWEEEE